MGRDTEFERDRRSRSPDRYGRDHGRNEEYQTSRDHGRRNERDSRREHDRERSRWSRDDEGERHHGDRQRDRRGERDGRDRAMHRSPDRYRRNRSSDRRAGRAADEGRVELDTQAKSNEPASTEKRSSRWGDAIKAGNGASGNIRLDNRTFGAEHRNGGLYGPADTGRPSGGGRGWGGSGGGGRGQGNGAPRDESWVEHRLKLRAEARLPRGVWNRSPSPPKKKEAKVTKAPAADNPKKTKVRDREQEDAREEARRAESAKRSRTKNAKRKPHRRRSPSMTSAASDSSSSSSSDSSSGGSSSSSSSSSSDSGDGGNRSNGDSSSGEERKKATRKGRVSSRSTEGQSRPGVARSVSPPSSSPLAAVIGVKTVDKDKVKNGASDEELDELDAKEAAQFKADVQGHRHHEESDEDDDGPMPVPQLDELQGEGERGVNYGGALLPGEGAAIAQFVQKGLRIPRRGEVGWAGQEIERLEDSGYVMSGSRHARMNAVRLRKENQVFNAEERRALALIMFEEKQQKENEILGNFRQMLTEIRQAPGLSDAVELQKG